MIGNPSQNPPGYMGWGLERDGLPVAWSALPVAAVSQIEGGRFGSVDH